MTTLRRRYQDDCMEVGRHVVSARHRCGNRGGVPAVSTCRAAAHRAKASCIGRVRPASTRRLPRGLPVPASDNRHDPGRQLVGRDGTRHDCYWQRKAQADKEPSIAASGQLQQYVFEIDNRCSKAVRVTLESTDGEFQWWCPTDSAQPPAGQHRPISCYVQYTPGPVDLRRSYTLKTTAFDEATILPVEFDPQVRLERAGSRLAFTGLPGAVP